MVLNTQSYMWDGLGWMGWVGYLPGVALRAPDGGNNKIKIWVQLTKCPPGPKEKDKGYTENTLVTQPTTYQL